MTYTGMHGSAYRAGLPDSRTGDLGWFFLCLNALFFGGLLVAAPETFAAAGREDGWVESLTAVWFFLAGLALLAAASAERGFFRRCVYGLGGAVMLLVCGEEISWGQRILGFETPDFPMGLINTQNEFNLHNFHIVSFEKIYRTGALLLCMATFASFLCRKDRLLGVPLPSIPLMLCFMATIFIRPIQFDMPFDAFVFDRHREILLLVLMYALLSGNGPLFAMGAATAALVSAAVYVHHRFYIVHAETGVGDRIPEAREYLIGLACLLYALEILSSRGRPAAIGKRGDRRAEESLSRAAICAPVVAGAVALAFFGWRVAETRIGEAHRAMASAEPVVRSAFDVWLAGNRAIYFKNPCGPADTGIPFFLHVHPADAADLPADRRKHGFDNLDFRIGRHYLRLVGDGACLATKRLPDYDIVAIRTGQYDGSGRIWEGEILPDGR